MLRRLINFMRHDLGLSTIECLLVAAIITVATTFAVSAAGYNITDILG